MGNATSSQKNYLSYHLSEAVYEISLAIAMVASENADLTTNSIFCAHLIHGFEHLDWFYHGLLNWRESYTDLSDDEHIKWSNWPETLFTSLERGQVCLQKLDSMSGLDLSIIRGELTTPAGSKLDMRLRLAANLAGSVAICRISELLLVVNDAADRLFASKHILDLVRSIYGYTTVFSVFLLRSSEPISFDLRTNGDIVVHLPAFLKEHLGLD